MEIKEKLDKKRYAQLVKSTLTNRGNPYRIKGAFSKNEIKIAYVGGSVTYGYIPEEKDTGGNFCEICTGLLQERFPDKSITMINCGISGTRCITGMCVSEYVLNAFKPDVVVVEYSINEERSSAGIARTEGLIRKLMNLESSPAVMIVSVVTKDGYSCEEIMKALAVHYNLYMTGLSESMYPLVKTGELDWGMYSGDEGHPSKAGHRFVGDCLYSAFLEALSDNSDADTFPQPLSSDEFENIRILSDTDYSTDFVKYSEKLFVYNGGIKNAEGSRLRLSISCSKFGVCFVQDNKEETGSAVVTVDGSSDTILQGYSIFGWHNPVVRLVIDDKEKQQHSIEIKMQPQDRKKIFQIIALFAD